MKEWRVCSTPEPGKEKGGVIIWWPEWDERDAREWFRENVENASEGHFYRGATLELVEFETLQERTERELRARVAELETNAERAHNHLTLTDEELEDMGMSRAEATARAVSFLVLSIKR